MTEKIWLISESAWLLKRKVIFFVSVTKHHFFHLPVLGVWFSGILVFMNE